MIGTYGVPLKAPPAVPTWLDAVRGGFLVLAGVYLVLPLPLLGDQVNLGWLAVLDHTTRVEQWSPWIAACLLLVGFATVARTGLSVPVACGLLLTLYGFHNLSKTTDLCFTATWPLEAKADDPLLKQKEDNMTTGIPVRLIRVRRTRRSAYIAVLVCCAAMGSAAGAQKRPSGLIKALQHTDSLTSEGMATYTEKVLRLSEPGNPPGVTRKPLTSYRESVAWNRKGQWRTEARCEEDSEGFTEIHSQGALVQPSRYSTVVRNDVTSRYSEFERMMGVAPGPCFIMGRGFSRLRNLHVTGSLTLVGTAKDGTEVTATFDPAHQYIAKTMQRRADGKLINSWTLTNPVRAGNVWLPGREFTQSYRTDGLRIEASSVRLVAASFLPVSPAVFEAPLNNGKPILDTRLGSSIGFKTPPPGLDGLDTLMEATRRQDALLRRKVELADEKRRNGILRNRIAVGLSVLLLAVCLGGAVVYRSQSKRTI